MGNSKKWTVFVLTVILVFLLLFSLMTYIMDPLMQFRSESKIFKAWEYSEMYSNPGIAKNLSYDTVIVGTSMVQNTDVPECDELFDSKCVKLTYSGGTSHNFKKILDICFNSDNRIKTVYWGLDENQLIVEPDSVRHALPEYLYKDDPISKIKYLLNVDIFYQYTLKNIIRTAMGSKTDIMPLGDVWGKDAVFSKDAVISGYSSPEQQSAKPENYYEEKIIENLECNVLSVINSHKDTEFVFFMPPYSMLYWNNEVKNGTLDATFYGLNIVMEKLLACDNVKIFFFQNDTDIITNLDNYKDYSHYKPEINSFMMESIKEDKYRLTLDNYKSVLDSMKDFVKKYDYDSLFK
ncbi:MAG: hypothetical protein IJM37_10035 [Lachnospiraceae bacterium]|nr:hypothetical protein [Lachnospiraceae bacterium]